MSLTIACVCVPGGIYTQWHVDRLEFQVKQYLRQPYKFTCITQSDKPGYWSKIDLFEPNRFSGSVLYFDLDVTIIGNLDDLADYPGSFVICRDWGRFGYNSSVMAWDAGTVDHLFTDFTSDVMEKMAGDQDWLTIKKPDAVKFPRNWCYSYRLGLKTGYPKDMRVCVYHGHPKPWEVIATAND